MAASKSMKTKGAVASSNGSTDLPPASSPPPSPRDWRWEATRLVVVAFYAAYGTALLSHLFLSSARLCPPSSSSSWCRGASWVLESSRGAGLPFVPTAGEDLDGESQGTTSSDRGTPGKKEEAAGSGRKTAERPKKRRRGGRIRRAFVGLFDPDRRRREREEERRRRDDEDDREAMREVVSKHRDHPGETVDRRHPVKHMVAEAAALFQRRKQRAAEVGTREVSPEEADARHARREREAEAWGKDAKPSKKAVGLYLTDDQRALVGTVSTLVAKRVPNMAQRSSVAGWGGSIEGGGRPWWNPHPASKKTAGGKKGKNAFGVDELLDRTEGARLVAAYLRIMQWPANGEGARFPFGPCKKKGCEIDFAFAHTLEWREKYRPWCVTPAVERENESGWIYVRGHSPAPEDMGVEEDTGEYGHSVVWFRPGAHILTNSEAYFRAILNSLDEAVANNMRRSSDAVGRYNIVLDTTGFSLAQIPKLHEVKRAFIMLQDHFPDRLGVLLIANLSGAAKLFLRMIMPLITLEVREKIHILPGDKKGSLEMLNSLIRPEFVPDWLGGPDRFRFDGPTVYGGEEYRHRRCTDEQGLEYLTTMPYHA